MWYQKLRVVSYELWVTSYELRVANYELPVTSCELRVASYELQVTRYEVRVTSYKLRVEILSHELRVQNKVCKTFILRIENLIYEFLFPIRVASCLLQVTSFSKLQLQVTSCSLRVSIFNHIFQDLQSPSLIKQYEDLCCIYC